MCTSVPLRLIFLLNSLINMALYSNSVHALLVCKAMLCILVGVTYHVALHEVLGCVHQLHRWLVALYASLHSDICDAFCVS